MRNRLRTLAAARCEKSIYGSWSVDVLTDYTALLTTEEQEKLRKNIEAADECLTGKPWASSKSVRMLVTDAIRDVIPEREIVITRMNIVPWDNEGVTEKFDLFAQEQENENAE